MFYDFAGDLHQGLIPALEALEKPASLLQVISQVGVVRAAIRALDQAGIIVVYPQFRGDVRIEFGLPCSCSVL